MNKIVGIDIGLTCTCIVCLSVKNIDVYRFGTKFNPELKKLKEDTPIIRYTTYARYLDKYLLKMKPLGTIVMENPHTTKVGNGLRLYTLRGAYLPVIGKYVTDKKVFHPTATEIKKYWTGNGKADKQSMINTCIEKSHIPQDDHEADSTAMAKMGINYY